jgi:hypothetical protein
VGKAREVKEVQEVKAVQKPACLSTSMGKKVRREVKKEEGK